VAAFLAPAWGSFATQQELHTSVRRFHLHTINSAPRNMRSTLVAAVLAAALAPQPALSDTPDVVVHEHESRAAKDPVALPQKNVMLRSERIASMRASDPEEAEPCSWKEWGDWSKCSVSCGEGRWVRTRIWVGDESCRMTDELLARSMQSANCSVDCGTGKESLVPATGAPPAAPEDAKSPKRKPCDNGRTVSPKKGAKIDDVIDSLTLSMSKTPNASMGKEADEMVNGIEDVLSNETKPTSNTSSNVSMGKEADEMFNDIEDVLSNKTKPTSNTSSDIVDAVIRENKSSPVSSRPIKEVVENILGPSNKSRSTVAKILDAVIRENKSSTVSDRPVKKTFDAIIGALTKRSKPPSDASRTTAADILDAVANASSDEAPIKTVEDVIGAINKSDRRFKPVTTTSERQAEPSSTTITTTATTTAVASDATTTAVLSNTGGQNEESKEEVARSLVVGDAAFEVAHLSDSTIPTIEDGIRAGLAEIANVSSICIATQTNVQESGNRVTALVTSFSIDLKCANATNSHRNCLKVDEEIQWMSGLPVEQLRDAVIRLCAAEIDGFSVTGFEARIVDANTMSYFPASQVQRDNRKRPKACQEASADASSGDSALPDVSQTRLA